MVSRPGASSLDETESVVLYSIGALGFTPLRSMVKLQKMHFLLANAFPDLQPLLNFRPSLLGPHSEVVESVLENLKNLNLVRQSRGSFALTTKGRHEFDKLHMNEGMVQVIEDFKDFLNDLPDNEVLTFIYIFYPEYISESAKWDELKGRRTEIAVSMLRKQKISFSKALEMSDLDGNKFIALLKASGVRWRTV